MWKNDINTNNNKISIIRRNDNTQRGKTTRSYKDGKKVGQSLLKTLEMAFVVTIHKKCLSERHDL